VREVHLRDDHDKGERPARGAEERAYVLEALADRLLVEGGVGLEGTFGRPELLEGAWLG
tara:strand:+ start:804 stop:980 length:177 start_codon:yes stop_codon:yes gene_type:complete